MKQFFILGVAVLLLLTQLSAQGVSDKWDLQRCIDYAAKNNISVKQADVQARLSAIETERTKLVQYPSANFSTNLGTQYGRSIDPTTNLFVNSQQVFQGVNLNFNAPIYNWGALQADKKIAEFNAKAALADVERIINDVSLNIATFYLQIVAAKQQIFITQIQISQTKTQLGFTRKRVEAGALPELNAAELEAQLARDTSSFITAQANFSQAVIQLKAAINLDMATPFEVEIPAVDHIALEPLADLEPAGLYQMALTNQPAQKVNNLRIQSATESIVRARAAYYPTLSAFAGLGTNFANSAQKITGFIQNGNRATTGFVTVSGSNYSVFQPDIQLTSSKRNFGQFFEGWGTQLGDNFRQNIGINLAVPIFNGGSARLGHERAKLNLANTQVAKQQIDLSLQQNIYQAHAIALAAMLRYNASVKTVDASQKAYDFAAKRYEAGLSNTLDLITNQNNLLRAKLEKLNNQFDYIFRIKLLEFYKGLGIKL